jgi:secretory phospholipase A2
MSSIINVFLFLILLFRKNVSSDDRLKQITDLKVLVNILEHLQKTNNSSVLNRKESLEAYLREYAGKIIGDDSRSGSDDAFVKFLPLTTYCGPGNWISILNGEQPTQKTVDEMDGCCEAHDKCTRTLRKEQDLQKYPGLSWMSSYFTRLHCSCDVDFLNCIDALQSSFLAVAVKWIYTIAQPQCFKEEFPIVNCTDESE